MPRKDSDKERGGRHGRTRWGRRFNAVVCALSTVVLASVATPAARAAPGGRALPDQEKPLPPTCAWRNISSAASGNTAYPDGAAVSWISYIYAHQGLLLHIKAQFPYARFMSFAVQPVRLLPNGSMTFAASGSTHLQDMQIKPDAGSVNPFRPGSNRAAAHRAYSIWIRFHTPSAASQSNILFDGAAGLGALIYRIVVPDKGRDALGGVPLPTIDKVIVLGTGSAPSVIHVSLCAPIVALRAYALAKQLAATTASWPAGVWHPTRADTPATPDGGHAYGALAVRLMRQPGLVVVRFKAPTFAHTYRGDALTGKEQVRYWSVCAYELSSGRLAGCVDDYQAELDRQGFATVIIGDPGQRPRAAALAQANWLPFAAGGQSVLIYRQLLGSPGFRQFMVPAPNSVSAMQAQMGIYYPTIVRCTLLGWTSNRCGARTP